MTISISPDECRNLCAVGRKGSGKSTILRELRAWWPYDCLVVDVNGDDETSPAVFTIPAGQVPDSWAELRTICGVPDDQVYVHARWVPDPRDAAWVDDVDRVLGLALHPDRHVLVQVHEIGTVAKPNQVRPHMEAILHQGRHKNVSLHTAGPRPVDVATLVLAQADYLAVFDLPAPQDKARIADAFGWDPREHDGVRFDELVRNLGVHDFLWMDARERTVTHCTTGT